MHKDIKAKDNLVIISNIEWGFLKQRHQNFALILKKDFNVIFVESSAKRNPSYQDIPIIIRRIFGIFRKKNSKSCTAKNNERVSVITPIVFPSTFRFFRLLNALFLSPILVKQIKKRCNLNRRTTIMTYLPTATVLDIIRSLEHNLLIYDCVSNFEAVEEMPHDTVYIENILIEKCDLVLTDCDYLYNKHYKLARKIEIIEPGVDSALFGSIQGEVCREINKIIYFGSIGKKIDFELIQYLVDRGIEVIMIGPLKCEHEILKKVDLRPEVNHEELPYALAEADALIIPYISNEFMKGVIPAKLFECFATGKPVITTYSENHKRYEKLILQGRSPKEIYRLIIDIDKIENKEKQQKRIDIAKRHDWKTLGDKFISYVTSMT